MEATFIFIITFIYLEYQQVTPSLSLSLPVTLGNNTGQQIVENPRPKGPIIGIYLLTVFTTLSTMTGNLYLVKIDSFSP